MGGVKKSFEFQKIVAGVCLCPILVLFSITNVSDIRMYPVVFAVTIQETNVAFWPMCIL